MKSRIGLMVLIAGLTACAAPQQRVVNIAAPFDASQAEKMLTGNGKLIGSGFMRQRGGGVVTCAGQTVTLIPATAYAKERLTAIYGNLDSVSIVSTSAPVFNPDVPEFKKHLKTATCDAQGNFEFDKVGVGDFYLQTGITWDVAGYNVILGVPTVNRQGGGIAMKVSLGADETKKVVLGK